MSKNKFYITTAIDYVNGAPHIGHALEKAQADVLARWHRQKGDRVFFLLGTDEHGTKIVETARKSGKEPREMADENAILFRKMNEKLNISFDNFIRTSDKEKHWPAAEQIWKALAKKGDIYKGKYSGYYCVGCEAYVQEKELIEGKCPIHKKEPEFIEEENYFFRLSRYEKELKKIISDDVVKIVPVSRKNEILNFIEQGLADVSFSRPKEALSWGVPVPEDDSQVMYVWCDALTNYLSGIGFPKDEYQDFWPADFHCIGKDILRFHAVIWPAMLLSAGLTLPKKIFVHGYLTVEGEKISKSLGNTIDPMMLVEKYGVDPVRYYLLREISSTEDGDFSIERFESRYNADLAGGLGNLVARVLTMAEKYGVKSGADILCDSAEEAIRKEYEKALEDCQFHMALDVIWKFIHHCDRVIEQNKPWELAKENKTEKLNEVIGYLLCDLGVIAELLEPFLPVTAEKIKQQLKEGKKGEALFPRI